LESGGGLVARFIQFFLDPPRPQPARIRHGRPRIGPHGSSVSGSVGHSLLIGQQGTEEFVAGGRHGSRVWQVNDGRFFIHSAGSRRNHLRLSAQGETTIFERELTYLTSGLWFWVLDFLLMRRRMNRESRIALEQLKERLERPALCDIA